MRPDQFDRDTVAFACLSRYAKRGVAVTTMLGAVALVFWLLAQRA